MDQKPRRTTNDIRPPRSQATQATRVARPLTVSQPPAQSAAPLRPNTDASQGRPQPKIQQPAAQTKRPRRRRRWPAVLITILVILLLAGAGFAWYWFFYRAAQ